MPANSRSKNTQANSESGEYDVIILGAGPGGLAAANELSKQISVLVIDAAKHCGGAHKSETIDEMTFDAGSFFFENEHPWFEQHPELREQFLPVLRRQRRIDPRGKLRDYPFEPRELSAWPLRVKLAAVRDYAVQFLSGRQRNPQRSSNAGEAARRVLGKTAFRFSGLEKYVWRLNDLEADSLGVEFFNSRMGYLRAQASPLRIVRLLSRSITGKHIRRGKQKTLLIRPRGGFSAVYDHLQAGLEEHGVEFAFNQPLASVKRNDQGFTLTIGKDKPRVVRAKRVISAMPIDLTYQAAFGKPSGLTSRNLLTLYVSAPHRSAEDIHRTGNVLFNFHEDGLWKRVTFHSDFYAPDAQRSFLSIEVTMSSQNPIDPQSAFSDFQAHMTELDIFGHGLELVGHEFTENAYPLLSIGSSHNKEQAITELSAFGIETVGRQGRFDYSPTSLQVIRNTQKRLAANDA